MINTRREDININSLKLVAILKEVIAFASKFNYS
jgi:hypothetical protein